MNTPSDTQLLRAFAESRSENAFAELVRRHIDFVHSAALRMTGDAELAKDVSQGVFTALAKDAGKLVEHPVLSGWLHKTARNIAAQAIRTETRRRHREQQAAAMNAPSANDASWDEISPHLDAALGDLSESDRDAVLLRYFENKPANAMAAILGVSTEAAQKRVCRAVEKLRENFAKRGITAGAAGLATTLSSHAVQTAPVGLAATLSSASLAGTMAAAQIFTMTLIQKSLIPLVAVVAGCIWLTDLSSEASQLDSRIAALRKQIASAETGGGAANSRTVAKPANDRKEWMKLARRISLLQARDVKDPPAQAELERRLEAMSATEILAMMDDMVTWDLPSPGFSSQLQRALLKAALEKNPPLAFRHFERHFAAGNKDLCDNYDLVRSFPKWIERDATGAMAWLDGIIASKEPSSPENQSIRNEMMTELREVSVESLLKSAPDQAIARFKSLTGDQQKAFFKSNYRLEKLGPGAEAGIMKLVRAYLTEEPNAFPEGGPYLDVAYRLAREGGFAKVDVFLDSIQATSEERRIFAEGAASQGVYQLKKTAKARITERAMVDEMRAWVATHAPQDVDRITGSVVRGQSNDSGFKNMSRIIEALYQETGNDELVVSFLDADSDGSNARKSAPRRAEMASWIKDDAQRERILLELQPDLEPPVENPK